MVVSYFTQSTEQQNQALKETQESILKAHEKMYSNKFNSMEEWIDRDGNSPRNRAVQNTVQKGEIILKSMLVEGKIENESVLPFLYKNYYSVEAGREVDDTKKILKELEVYKGNNQIIKQVNFLNCYQTSFYYLYKHYERVGSYSTPYSTMDIVNASDTTIGMGVYNAAELQSKVWWMKDPSNILRGIKVEIYTEGDTITKMYKVIRSQNAKPRPFDYEEIK